MGLDVGSIAKRFEVAGSFVEAMPFGSGHINDTYVVRFDAGEQPARYVLQRINHAIFRDVDALMSNITRVCVHVEERLVAEGVADVSQRCLRVIPAADGKAYVPCEDGTYWRMYNFIEDAIGYDIVETPEQARTAAAAFGRFQYLLTDMPGPRLHETIRDFHHTPKRIQAFDAALDADAHNRAALAKAEIQWLDEHRELAWALLKLHEQGDMPERITHNDTKLNNVLIDPNTNEAMCVIDLDTVMPGLALYDFGDLVRTSTSPAAEDERDLSQVTMQLPMFDALVRGYLQEAHRFLTPAEVQHLSVAGMVITFTIGTRFLTDYLNGDVYYKTHREHHNLDRCRTQFALIRSMFEQQDAMTQCIEQASRDVGNW